MMKKKMKKIVAILLMGIMLLGGALTVQAAEIQSSTCSHEYRQVDTVLRSVNATHQYVINGVTKDCIVTTKLVLCEIKCKHCGSLIDSWTETRDSHSTNHT